MKIAKRLPITWEMMGVVESAVVASKEEAVGAEEVAAEEAAEAAVFRELLFACVLGVGMEVSRDFEEAKAEASRDLMGAKMEASRLFPATGAAVVAGEASRISPPTA